MRWKEIALLALVTQLVPLFSAAALGRRLDSSKLVQNGEVLCGWVNNRWQPGTLLGNGSFVTHLENFKQLNQKAQRKKGKARKRLQTQAKGYKQRNAAELASCTTSNGPPRPSPNPGGGDPTPTPSGTPAPGQPAFSSADVLPGYGAAIQMAETGSLYAYYAVAAVFEASIQGSGGAYLVVTGTLTQAAPNSTVFTYTSQPADRLRVVTAGGSAVEYFVQTINGDFSSTATNFLNGAHDLSVRAVISAADDLTIASSQHRNSELSADGTRTASLTGSFTFNNAVLQGSLQEAGTYHFDVDSTGSEYERNSTYTGTITGSGLSITVNEGWHYRSVTASNVGRDLPDGRHVTSWTASETARSCTSSWTAGGNSFSWQGGLIKAAFIEGIPNETDSYWGAEGNLLLNGAVAGHMEMIIDLATIKAQLVLADQRTDMQTWQRR